MAVLNSIVTSLRNTKPSPTLGPNPLKRHKKYADSNVHVIVKIKSKPSISLIFSVFISLRTNKTQPEVMILHKAPMSVSIQVQCQQIPRNIKKKSFGKRDCLDSKKDWKG